MADTCGACGCPEPHHDDGHGGCRCGCAAFHPSAMCQGPFIWYPCSGGALLYCAACSHLTVTGNFNEWEHAATPVLLEGLA